jgi:hypothetical protein
MPDQPIPSPDEQDEIVATVARLILDAIEKDLPEEKRADDYAAFLFSEAFRLGVLTAIDGLAHRLPLRDFTFDPRDATKEQVGNWLEREVFAMLAEWNENVVEWTLRRILRDEGEEDEP